MDKKLLFGILAAVIAIGAAIFIWWKNQTPPAAGLENLGSEILEKVQNPLKGELSAANPFEAEANPFSKDLNPFTDVYKNPFE